MVMLVVWSKSEEKTHRKLWQKRFAPVTWSRAWTASFTGVVSLGIECEDLKPALGSMRVKLVSVVSAHEATFNYVDVMRRVQDKPSPLLRIGLFCMQSYARLSHYLSSL